MAIIRAEGRGLVETTYSHECDIPVATPATVTRQDGSLYGWQKGDVFLDGDVWVLTDWGPYAKLFVIFCPFCGDRLPSREEVQR